MLTVFGSMALDTIRTPSRTLYNILGGASTYAAISASYFIDTGLIAVAGEDLPQKYYKLLDRYLDLEGLVISPGKTFRYDGQYDKTLNVRKTLKTRLNVLEHFKPAVPERYKKSKFVYLATNDPQKNISLIKEFDNVKFSMCDTIDFWIMTKRDAVIKMIKAVDAVVINDEEARLLTKESNLIKCAKKMRKWGVRFIVIKKAEHGSILFFDDVIFPTSAFPLEHVVDPTGAGDSFAGAMIGYMAKHNSTSMSSIKKAIAYGSVMGSFAVGSYGLDGITGVTKSDISKRMRHYQRMIRF